MNTLETYLNSLPEDILTLDISCKGIKYLPNLTRFKNLEELYCSYNELISLPTLPQNLKKLSCSANQITSLPNLPQTLEILYCSDNQLTSLPTLPQNLEILYCYSNELTSLPTLPHNLELLHCSNNQLTSLPTPPQNLKELYCHDNPISKIVNFNCLIKIKQHIQILNNFRYLYYCLKFKKHFRKWLWEKVRLPNVNKMYSPNYLIENLRNEDDLDLVLDNWK
jgi:Leucine-rich repeat (LRR) protein